MAELHADRRRALSFGAVADAYDRLRPHYSDAALDAITAGARTALDVGGGTGILARQLRDRGLDVLVVEPDEAMAEVARSTGLAAEVATFEEWEPGDRTFDLITFGQSWHWVNAEVALPRLAGLLTPHGRVALLWNKLRPTVPSNDELLAATPDYRNVDGVSSDPARSDVALEDLSRSLEPHGFTVSRRDDSWIETQAADRWLDLVFTYSAHSTLPEDRRAAMRRAMAGVIGDRDVQLAASTMTVLAQR